MSVQEHSRGRGSSVLAWARSSVYSHGDTGWIIWEFRSPPLGNWKWLHLHIFTGSPARLDKDWIAGWDSAVCHLWNRRVVRVGLPMGVYIGVSFA